MKNIRHIFLCYFAMFVALNLTDVQIAHAGLILPGNDPFHIAEGQNPNYAAVGFIFQYDTNGQMVHLETMNLVHSNFIGSAIHGIDGVTGDIYFGFGSYSAPTEVRKITEFYRHPTSDFFLGFTDNPVINIAPVKIFDGTLQNGDRIALAGFGGRVYVGDDPSTAVFDGERRAGTHDVIRNVGVFAPDQFTTSINSVASSQYTPGEMGAWSGDSGGGGFTQNFELAAIADSVNLNTNLGAITNFTIYPKVWSDSTIETRMTAVPEPSSLILLGFCSSFLGFLKKRKKLV